MKANVSMEDRFEIGEPLAVKQEDLTDRFDIGEPTPLKSPIAKSTNDTEIPEWATEHPEVFGALKALSAPVTVGRQVLSGAIGTIKSAVAGAALAGSDNADSLARNLKKLQQYIDVPQDIDSFAYKSVTEALKSISQSITSLVPFMLTKGKAGTKPGPLAKLGRGIVGKGVMFGVDEYWDFMDDVRDSMEQQGATPDQIKAMQVKLRPEAAMSAGAEMAGEIGSDLVSAKLLGLLGDNTVSPIVKQSIKQAIPKLAAKAPEVLARLAGMYTAEELGELGTTAAQWKARQLAKEKGAPVEPGDLTQQLKETAGTTGVQATIQSIIGLGLAGKKGTIGQQQQQVGRSTPLDPDTTLVTDTTTTVGQAPTDIDSIITGLEEAAKEQKVKEEQQAALEKTNKGGINALRDQYDEAHRKTVEKAQKRLDDLKAKAEKAEGKKKKVLEKKVEQAQQEVDNAQVVREDQGQGSKAGEELRRGTESSGSSVQQSEEEGSKGNAEEVEQSPIRTIEEWRHEYYPLWDKTLKAEKEPTRKMTDKEKEVWKEDWKAFSRLRGYTEEEIADYDRYLQLREEGRRLGVSEEELSTAKPPLSSQTNTSTQPVTYKTKREAIIEARKTGGTVTGQTGSWSVTPGTKVQAVPMSREEVDDIESALFDSKEEAEAAKQDIEKNRDLFDIRPTQNNDFFTLVYTGNRKALTREKKATPKEEALKGATVKAGVDTLSPDDISDIEGERYESVDMAESAKKELGDHGKDFSVKKEKNEVGDNVYKLVHKDSKKKEPEKKVVESVEEKKVAKQKRKEKAIKEAKTDSDLVQSNPLFFDDSQGPEDSLHGAVDKIRNEATAIYKAGGDLSTSIKQISDLVAAHDFSPSKYMKSFASVVKYREWRDKLMRTA
jgi:hypothetical protein